MTDQTYGQVLESLIRKRFCELRPDMTEAALIKVEAHKHAVTGDVRVITSAKACAVHDYLLANLVRTLHATRR